MHKRMLGLGWRGRLAWTGLGLAAVALAAWLAVQPTTPFVHAQEPKATPTPTTGEDCFGGALADNPLHCYVLAAAHSEGTIEVDAVYRAGRSLYFFLAQTRPVSDEVYRYIEQKALGWQSDGRVHKCRPWPRGCDLGVLPNGKLGYILPLLTGHEDLRLLPGGAEARRSRPGWASYRQLWPVVAEGARGAASAATVTSGFDVSDVNTTTLSDLHCGVQSNSVTYGHCLDWERHPGLGIAGWHTGGGTHYVQVKASTGQEDNFAAVKEELYREYRKIPDGAIVIIPVKYDYQDLWRWTEVIRRFVTSSANTIGILRAKMGENYASYYGGNEQVVYPLPELPEAGRILDKRERNPAELRTTIQVFTLELQRTVAALPELLPALGIPVDAVGVVYQLDETPRGRRAIPLAETSRAPQPVSQPPPPAGSQASAGSVTDAVSSADGAMAASVGASDSDEAKPSPDGAVASSEGASDGSEGASDQAEPAQAVEPAPEERSVSRWLLVGAAGALALAAAGLAASLGLRRAGRRA